ncbi:uncharacterized protein EI90DRAFT_3062957 [Cantharellus anzutake]|uniref:uncharacterized protein n=1 Tax=Cantharellus anzutake TaxID=1750568 RepID=UPI001904D0EB|nr:uncharacterized protein EI90DRAFT_3062957 [Cantharellus anzutake]KAF8329543.1 hypothetical protein EI90DRAFT_3062957 [Cantharellus anzutake]
MQRSESSHHLALFHFRDSLKALTNPSPVSASLPNFAATFTDNSKLYYGGEASSRYGMPLATPSADDTSGVDFASSVRYQSSTTPWLIVSLPEIDWRPVYAPGLGYPHFDLYPSDEAPDASIRELFHSGHYISNMLSQCYSRAAASPLPCWDLTAHLEPFRQRTPTTADLSDASRQTGSTCQYVINVYCGKDEPSYPCSAISSPTLAVDRCSSCDPTYFDTGEDGGGATLTPQVLSPTSRIQVTDKEYFQVNSGSEIETGLEVVTFILSSHPARGRGGTIKHCIKKFTGRVVTALRIRHALRI